LKRENLTSDRPFQYRRHGKSANGQLCCDETPLSALAEKFGTPLYVYSATYIHDRYRKFDHAFRNVPHTICYSVKANSNLSILRLLARLGSAFDVVSGGELERIRRLGVAAAKRVVFSGVGKTAAEMDAAIKADILIFNVESEGELRLLAERAARLRKKVRVALRVNPDVFAETHPYISTGLREHKFGVDIRLAPELYSQAARSKNLEVTGVSVHIGSQITSVEPFAAAMRRVAELVRQLRRHGHRIRYVDAGGGLGISYQWDTQFDFGQRVKDYAEKVTEALQALDVHLLLEPGRSIIGPAGALLTRVLYNKRNGSKRFLIVDAGMNDLIRPALYKAHHEIVPVEQSRGSEEKKFDVVGPVCETGDFFAHDRELPEVPEGALVAILDTGAYGFSIASNYNSRPRPAEVLVEGKKARLIRKRETMEYLLKPEL
jgi:diaminopimelate decarboxylase